MTSAEAQRLLWDALQLPPAEAREAWQAWRAASDLDILDSGSYYLLPILTERLPAWVAKDPQGPILVGICRKGWSQNQLQKKVLADAQTVLKAAGIERMAATGPVVWGDLYWPNGAIRLIGRVDLLVEPACVRAAFRAFAQAGWKTAKAVPDTRAKGFPFAGGAAFEAPSERICNLYWRPLPNSDFSLQPPEFPPLSGALPLEYALVAALGRVHEDNVAWQFDALMILRQPGLRWDVVKDLLRWRSAQREKLTTLRSEWGADVPAEVTKPAPTQGLERILASALRTYRRARRGAGRPSAVRP